jgi:hypothetical protein
MMIKIGNDFLDFNADIEVENISKVFEEISYTYGDFSYQFSISATTPNLVKLGLPALIDLADKSIYDNIEATICDDDGIPLYYGQIRVEDVSIEDSLIQCSFYSGNYNWIAMLTGNVNDLDFSEYDTELSVTTIEASWLDSDGLVFPFIDNGALITRSYETITPADFNGCMYVKTIFEKIFFTEGIKIKGELINDPIFQRLIIAKNNKDKEEIDAKACYVEKDSTTALAVENTQYKCTFDNDSTYPFYDGTDNAFDLANSKYVAPCDMQVEIEVDLTFSSGDPTYSNRIYIYINGAFTFVDIGLAVGGLYNSAIVGNANLSYKRTITLNEGDEVEVYAEWQQSGGSTPIDVIAGTWRMKPIFLFQVKGSSAVPAWTKQEFVANILNIFNVVSDFNPFTKVVTFNFFDRIKSKTPIDISQYIKITNVDYSEFISNYGRKNIFAYEESDDEEIRDYNITKFIKYGAGSIDIENAFIPETADVVKSKFKAPISYLNGVFGCSLERTNFLTIEESDEIDFTAVTDAAGVARFTTADNAFLVGDIVRIKESNVKEYIGDWRVSARDVTYFELQGVSFTENGSGKASKANRVSTNSDDVFLFVNVPNLSVSSFADVTPFNFPSVVNTVTSLSYAFFNVLENGRTINTVYEQGLSFGNITSEFTYQRSILETYWRNFSDILSDPVKIYAEGRFPKSVYMQLTPLQPVYIKHEKTSNLYYINRNTGYKKSSDPCYLELIKL